MDLLNIIVLFLSNSVEPDVPRDEQYKESLEIKQKLARKRKHFELALYYQARSKYPKIDDSNEPANENFDNAPECILEVDEEPIAENFGSVLEETSMSDKTEKSDLQCEICNYIAKNKAGLTHHMKTPHRKCENCGIPFFGVKSKRAHAAHIKKCTKTLPTCPTCAKTFDFPYLLKKHMKNKNHYSIRWKYVSE